MAYFMTKKIKNTITDYAMIGDGDRIAVAVSGGKDSLGLLTLLQFRQRRVPEHYELVAIHVRGDSRGPDTPPYPPLETWLQAQQIEYAIVPLDLPPDEPLPLTCHRCAWNRRKTIFQIADRLGCNVVAFAHHADDLAQTALLNLFYAGRLETMPPKADYFEGRFRLIRPLAFLPEKYLVDLARAWDFAPPPPPCPQALHSRRERVARMLRELERNNHQVRANVIRAALGQEQATQPEP
jgi:tRNA 2-thiocytidine biosynthesis protein TtcA